MSLVYQPIIDIRTGETTGYEALARWQSRYLGKLLPQDFIYKMEENGLIDQLTCRVIEQVINKLGKTHTIPEHAYISLNISRCSLLNWSFVLKLAAFAQRFPKYVKKIVLEVSEQGIFTSPQYTRMAQHLKIIRSLGFKLAIDDFGSGNAGLNQLRQGLFDVIKIDKLFVHGAEYSQHQSRLLQDVIALAAKYAKCVIVEGVETSAQLTIIGNSGANYVQGYHFSRPESLVGISEIFSIHYPVE